MSSSGKPKEHSNFDPSDERFIQRVAEQYAPQPLSPIQRATFDRKLEERLANSSRLPFLRPATVLVPACAALLLWFALPLQKVAGPDVEYFGPQTVPTIVAEHTLEGEPSVASDTSPHTNLLTYAYYQSESYGEEDASGEIHILPDEYIALADAFELL